MLWAFVKKRFQCFFEKYPAFKICR